MKGLALLVATVLVMLSARVERQATRNSSSPSTTLDSFNFVESTPASSSQSPSSRDRVFFSNEVATTETPNTEGQDKEPDELPPGTVEVSVYDDGKLTTAAQVMISLSYVDGTDPDFWTAAAIPQDNRRFRLGGLDWGSYQVSVEMRGTKQEDSFTLSDKPFWDSKSTRKAFHFGHSRVVGKLCDDEQGPEGEKEVQLVVEDSEGYELCSFQREGTGKALFFTFDNLPAGQVEILWYPEEAPRWGKKRFRIGGTNTESIFLGKCPENLRVRGKVLTLSGHPIPFANFLLRRLDALSDEEIHYTDAEGQFAISLTPGPYRIDCVKLWDKMLVLAPSSSSVFDVSRNMLPLEIVVQNCTVIATLHMKDPKESPWDSMQAIEISLDGEGQTHMHDSRRMKDRRFVLPGVRPGSHRIQIVDSHGWIHAEETIEIAESERLIEVDLFQKQD